ncbi:hypothetical protein B0H13DRAFT_2411263 [Mycena leptocephala]|nr:hypothetical protein B0H13DRAFT_2411263 [Mycena leptocephala]
MDAFPMSNSNVARVIHQSQKLIHPTPASSAQLTLDSMGSIPAPQAPLVPDGVHAKGKQRVLQIGAQIRAHMTNPTMNTADALMEKANTFLKEVSSTQSPITQRNHVKSLADWAGYLAVAKPLVPTEQHWDRNIIEDNWNRFLFTMVHVYKPRDPLKPLKANTLVWWSGVFLHLMVPVLSNIRCLRLGYMDYQFLFRMQYSKNAIGTAVGDEQTFLITGCLFAHNIVFNLTVPLLAHLFHLRRFEKKCQAKLVEDDSAELKIDPLFKDTPIFLAGNEGGQDFASSEMAAMAESAYEVFGEWCQKAGLSKVGFRALHSLLIVSLQMGTHVAKDVLHHQTDGPFWDSYSRDTQNFDFVPLHLGEVAGTKESALGEKIAAREAPDSEQAAKYARESFKKNLVNSDLLQPLSAARNGAWAAYIGCFNASVACYKMGTEGCNRIYNIASGIINNPASEKKPVAFSHPWNKDTTIPPATIFFSLDDDSDPQTNITLPCLESLALNDPGYDQPVTKYLGIFILLALCNLKVAEQFLGSTPLIR